MASVSQIISYLYPSNYNGNEMNRIKEIIQEKGLTQVWLAGELGKSFKMVNAYACNRKQPSLETLYRIAELLQVNIKDLIIDSALK